MAILLAMLRVVASSRNNRATSRPGTFLNLPDAVVKKSRPWQRRLLSALPDAATATMSSVAKVENDRGQGLTYIGRESQTKTIDSVLQSVHAPALSIVRQIKRMQQHSERINLMPAESYPTRAVHEACKLYLPGFEGYPGKRYYAGAELADEIEQLCWATALETFGLNPEEWVVNTQAFSGSLANLYVYVATVKEHDTILRMELSHGGHLSHGHEVKGRKISETSRRFTTVPYHVRSSDDLIDYEEIQVLCRIHRPRIITAGGSAYCRRVDFQRLRDIADKYGTLLHYDMAHDCGLVAAGVTTSPFQFCDIVTATTYKTLRGPLGALIFCRHGLKDCINSTVFPRFQSGANYRTILAIAVALKEAQTSKIRAEQLAFLEGAQVLANLLQRKGHKLLTGGTDSHMLLVDLRHFGLSGGFVEQILELSGIICNKNTVPGDGLGQCSGLRLGTPPMVIRGMTAESFNLVANLVHEGICLALDISKKMVKQPVLSKRSLVSLDQPLRARLLRLQHETARLAKEYPLPKYLQ